jgi:uncharacterized coiled-coil protein SlyX
LVATLSDKDNTNRLFFNEEIEPFKLLDSWLNGTGNVKLPHFLANGGIRKTFDQQRQILDSLVKRLEEIYSKFTGVPDVSYSSQALYNETRIGPQQSNWKAVYEPDGRLKGKYITPYSCVFHKPSTATVDAYRVDRDVLRINDACALMKQNFADNSALTFQYVSTINGLTMDFPGSIRGLGFDNRYQPWFKNALAPPKDLIIVVDRSGSMEPSAPCGALKMAIAQVESILWSFLTDRDRVQLILVGGESPLMSPCFGRRLVPGTKDNLNVLLEWFHRASRGSGGGGSFSIGIVEALNILDQGKVNGDSTGGKGIVIAITDGMGVENVLDAGLHVYAQQAGKSVPLSGVHIVGIALTRDDEDLQAATPLDLVACAQRGLVWKLMVAQNSTDARKCSFKYIDIPIDGGHFYLKADPSFLINATDIFALAAFPPQENGGLPSPAYWQNMRADIKLGNDTIYRKLLSVSKPFYDKQSDPPRVAGVAQADFSMDDFSHAFRSIDLPSSTNIFILKHKDGVGHVIEWTSVAPDVSDYAESYRRKGEFQNVDIVDIEGNTLESAGVLEAISKESEGSRTIERRLGIGLAYTASLDGFDGRMVREDVALVTYFWKRIPQTSLTVLLSVVGSPTTQGGDSIIVPRLKTPDRCPRHVSITNRSSAVGEKDTCWASTYYSFPSVYHRLDLLTNSSQFLGMFARFTSPFGGLQTCGRRWCSYDTSTWLGSPSSFISHKSYVEKTLDENMIDAINKEVSDDDLEEETMLGGGLRAQALNAVKITGNMEEFWKQVLGAEGSDENGNPTSLSTEKAEIRREIFQLFFGTEMGILRTYPASLSTGPVEHDFKREMYYARAVTSENMIISSPYLPVHLGFENPPAWTITFSKAIYPFGYKQERGFRNVAFGVAGVHYRFDAFVKMFRKATTLREFFKFGCGDAGTSALADKGLACFLLSEDTTILLDSQLMSLKEQPRTSLFYDPSMKSFLEEEPFIANKLIEDKVFAKERVRYGVDVHEGYKINREELFAFTEKKNREARAAGEPETDLLGIYLQKRIQNPNGVSFNNLFLYQVPRTSTYLLVVTGYVPLDSRVSAKSGKRRYFCGSLSLHCPLVLEPTKATIVPNECNASLVPPQRVSLNTTSTVAEGTDPTFRQVRMLHLYNALATDFRLQCPQEFQAWSIAFLVAGGLLFILLVGLVVKFVGVRARRRLAANKVSQLASTGHVLTPMSVLASVDDTSAPENLEDSQLGDYKALIARQWQLAENLSTRDEGDLMVFSEDVLKTKEDVYKLREQLDYLYKRMQKQDVFGSKMEKMRRKIRKLHGELKAMSDKVDGLQEEGHLPGLDPFINQDADQLRSEFGNTLPHGTRESIFHRLIDRYVETCLLDARCSMMNDLEIIDIKSTLTACAHTQHYKHRQKHARTSVRAHTHTS